MSREGSELGAHPLHYTSRRHGAGGAGLLAAALEEHHGGDGLDTQLAGQGLLLVGVDLGQAHAGGELAGGLLKSKSTSRGRSPRSRWRVKAAPSRARGLGCNKGAWHCPQLGDCPRRWEGRRLTAWYWGQTTCRVSDMFHLAFRRG